MNPGRIPKLGQSDLVCASKSPIRQTGMTQGTLHTVLINLFSDACGSVAHGMMRNDFWFRAGGRFSLNSMSSCNFWTSLCTAFAQVACALLNCFKIGEPWQKTLYLPSSDWPVPHNKIPTTGARDRWSDLPTAISDADAGNYDSNTVDSISVAVVKFTQRWWNNAAKADAQVPRPRLSKKLSPTNFPMFKVQVAW